MRQLLWLQPIVVVVGIVLAAAAARRPSLPQAGALVQASLVAISTVALARYVAGEDDYRRSGISRWDAYDAKALTVIALAAGAAAAVTLAVTGVRGPRRLAVAGFLASVAAGALIFFAVLANSLN